MTEHSKKLRVLFGVAERSARGGINACEPPFISAVGSSGAEVFEVKYLFDNREDTTLFTRIRQVVSAAADLSRLARSESVDVIHLNTSFELRSLLRDAYTLFRLGGKTVFLKFHGSNLRLLRSRNPLIRGLVGYVLRRASGLGVLSGEEREAFIEAGVPPGKVFTVKNAVEPLSFPLVEKGNGLSGKLLFVSRLVPTKGLDDAVKAVEILLEKGRDVTLDVLGTGEADEPAKRLAATLGIAERIRFHGHVSEENVQGFCASSDILVFPTFHDEGLPMVVFGALRFGLPIVTTKLRAMADYLTEGENCLFCHPHDPESVADAIERLMDDEVLVGRIKKNNLSLSSEFIPERIASEYIRIYRQLGDDFDR